MKSLGFHQGYFEQVMSYSPEVAGEIRAEPEGAFAFATPRDKAFDAGKGTNKGAAAFMNSSG